MRARIPASTRSVLASRPVTRAKSRAWRGLTRAKSTPAAVRASVTGRSYPPGGFEHDEATMRRLREAGERGRRGPDPVPLAGREGEDINPVPGDIDAEDIS